MSHNVILVHIMSFNQLVKSNQNPKYYSIRPYHLFEINEPVHISMRYSPFSTVYMGEFRVSDLQDHALFRSIETNVTNLIHNLLEEGVHFTNSFVVDSKYCKLYITENATNKQFRRVTMSDADIIKSLRNYKYAIFQFSVRDVVMCGGLWHISFEVHNIIMAQDPQHICDIKFNQVIDDNEDKCLLCLDKTVHTINIPCNHAIMCIDCANKYTDANQYKDHNDHLKCCMCRQTIKCLKIK